MLPVTSPATSASPAPGPSADRPVLWWASIASAHPSQAALLTAAERARWEAAGPTVVGARVLLGSLVLRLAAAAALGQTLGRLERRALLAVLAAVPLTRDCPSCGEPHGRPRVCGLAGLSLSHAGSAVGVATADEEVGLDVVDGRRVSGPVRARILAPGERAPSDEDGWRLRWAAKEAALKATGEGLAPGLASVRVGPAGPGGTAPVHRAAGAPFAVVREVAAPEGHRAVLAALGPGPLLPPEVRDAGPVLAGLRA